jgi:hypothetical protein
MEGSATDDSNPGNIAFDQEPVLVGDITVKDPLSSQTLTLDGIFGMNNLIASADFSMDSSGGISSFNAATGNFSWITFDEPNGILGLTLDPSVLSAANATARAAAIRTVTPSVASPTVSTVHATVASSVASPVATTDLTPATTPAPVTEVHDAARDTRITLAHVGIAKKTAAVSPRITSPKVSREISKKDRNHGDDALRSPIS